MPAILRARKEETNIDLGTFTVDVTLQENGKFDVYVTHKGSYGTHHRDVGSADEIGSLVAEEIKSITKEHQNEFEEEEEEKER